MSGRKKCSNVQTGKSFIQLLCLNIFWPQRHFFLGKNDEASWAPTVQAGPASEISDVAFYHNKDPKYGDRATVGFELRANANRLECKLVDSGEQMKGAVV